MDVLTDGLRSRALLLVLDNCEHLVDSCGELAQRLLQHCPELRILATSREPLGVAGETTWRVPPLGLPERRPDLPAAMVAQSEAARLFAQRASAALPGFSLAQHAATVARNLLASGWHPARAGAGGGVGQGAVGRADRRTAY